MFSNIGADDTIKTQTLKQRETNNNSQNQNKLPNDVSNSSLIGNEIFHPGKMRESYKVYDTDGSIIEDTESKRFSPEKNRKKSDGGVLVQKASRT